MSSVTEETLIPVKLWLEITRVVNNIDTEEPAPTDIAYLRGLVNAHNLPYTKEEEQSNE